ncbi:hypothetical protein J8281_15135 [Aquimarina sp. U1-2]|uniref:hypothetical protein n=1 Tax=Aquimarina sp. U1-2 TaxID=2823141 RepID=UPI001AEC986A|nr:hypothetical protein [Aquimarina sp. U1-2]MBP2833528.1 hypothetical protein [Aquimarina sp. U1-2]
MKKIFALVCFTTLLLTSCSNDDDAIDFDTIGTTIDLDPVTFGAPDFAVTFSFIDNNIEVFDSDVVQVFRREGTANGEPLWEPLPTASFFFFNETTNSVDGFLNYRYNFTIDDVEIVLNFDVADGNLVGPEFTTNQIFRIVVLPSAFAEDNGIDIQNYDALSSALQLKSKTIPKMAIQQQ